MGIGKGRKPPRPSEEPESTNADGGKATTTNMTFSDGSKQLLADVPFVTSEQLAQLYRFEKHLGSGAFSQVYGAVDLRSGQNVAVKVVARKDCVGKEGLIRREASIIRKCRHPNIVTLMEIFETSVNVYMVMELVTGGELFDYVVGKGLLEPYEAATILHDVLIGLEYLHGIGISHRDLKPENLLFQETADGFKTKIADFGLASFIVPKTLMVTACGTPGYVAPEVLERQGYTPIADLWSLGVIAYTVLCGYPPFYEQTNTALFEMIRQGAYEFDSPYWDDIPDLATDFVSKLLVVEASARMTASQALQHPYITQYSQNIRENVDRKKVEEEQVGRKLGDGQMNLNDSGFVASSSTVCGKDGQEKVGAAEGADEVGGQPV